jgi:hypothetical protein
MTYSFLRKLLVLGAAAGALSGAPAMAADGEQPWRGSAKDDGYPVPQPPPADYNRGGSYKDDPAPPPAPRRHASSCLSKYGIRHALNEQGWHEFDNVEMRGDVAFMTAAREGGRRFELQVDSCTGDVIEARPRVVYVDPPPAVYYGPRYYEPRPAIGFYFGGGGRHRW